MSEHFFLAILPRESCSQSRLLREEKAKNASYASTTTTATTTTTTNNQNKRKQKR